MSISHPRAIAKASHRISEPRLNRGDLLDREHSAPSSHNAISTDVMCMPLGVEIDKVTRFRLHGGGRSLVEATDERFDG